MHDVSVFQRNGEVAVYLSGSSSVGFERSHAQQRARGSQTSTVSAASEQDPSQVRAFAEGGHHGLGPSKAHSKCHRLSSEPLNRYLADVFESFVVTVLVDGITRISREASRAPTAASTSAHFASTSRRTAPATIT